MGGRKGGKRKEVGQINGRGKRGKKSGREKGKKRREGGRNGGKEGVLT